MFHSFSLRDDADNILQQPSLTMSLEMEIEDGSPLKYFVLSVNDESYIYYDRIQAQQDQYLLRELHKKQHHGTTKRKVS